MSEREIYLLPCVSSPCHFDMFKNQQSRVFCVWTTPPHILKLTIVALLTVSQVVWSPQILLLVNFLVIRLFVPPECPW